MLVPQAPPAPHPLRCCHRPYHRCTDLILDAKVQLQLQVLNHQILQSLLDDPGQHDAQREPFEQLTAQQNLDGLPLCEETLRAVQVLLLCLQ